MTNRRSERTKLATTLPIYVTAQQVAEMLQVNQRSVERWANDDATMPASRFVAFFALSESPYFDSDVMVKHEAHRAVEFDGEVVEVRRRDSRRVRPMRRSDGGSR